MAFKPPGHRAAWCVHYRATNHKTCEAGVNYGQLGGELGTAGMLNRFPCFASHDPATAGAVICSKRRMPTAEEIALRNTWQKERTEKLVAVMATTLPYREQARKTRGLAAIIDCAACGGKLTLSIAIASNGHCHGKCSTEGCMSWME